MIIIIIIFVNCLVINQNYVLTAGHCTNRFEEDKKSYKNYNFIASGPNHDLTYIYQHDEYYRKIENYYKHPKYKNVVVKNERGELLDSYNLYDIALIRLETPFKLGKETGKNFVFIIKFKLDTS